MSSYSTHSCQKGFTLLEILVVLSMTVFLSTILLQGFNQMARLVNRLDNQIEHSITHQLQTIWLKDIISGILPMELDEKQPAVFTRTKITAVTLKPLLGSPEQPTHFNLEFQQDDDETLSLIYTQSPHQPLYLGQWQAESAVFLYLDQNHKLQKKVQQLPRGILIHITGNHDSKQWYIALPLFNTVGPVEFDLTDTSNGIL